MWRHIWLIVGLLTMVFGNGCSFDNTPKRLSSYLDTPPRTSAAVKSSIPSTNVTAALVVINDTGFEKSAPELQPGTLQSLSEHLQVTIQKQLPIQLSSIQYPDNISPTGSPDQFIQIAKDENVPYLLLAVLSSTEWEVADRLPLHGFQQGGGLRSMGLVGYRAENYARLELAFVDGQTGQSVVTTDGQAWATLERLAVPLESNVYPVVRRALTQPPIYPNSEEDAFETLRWVSGQDAIGQAVMHLEEAWEEVKAS